MAATSQDGAGPLNVTKSAKDALRSNTVYTSNIQPHHHTITDAGNYEYFASNGRSAMAYVKKYTTNN